MSFRAIYTDKHGNQKLIKLPWYAAFQGAPSRRERIEATTMEKTCSQCRGLGVEARDCGQCGGKGKVPVDKPKEPNTTRHYSAHAKEEYSKKNDKTIIQMKNAGKSWKEILEAIGKESQSQLKEHYKTNLQARAEQADNATGAQGYSAHAKEEYSKKNDKTIIQMKNAGKTWKEILVAIGKESQSQLKEHYKNNLQERAEQAKQGGGGGGGNSWDQKTGQDKDDSRRDNRVARMASELMKQHWATLAANHYDASGDRITPEEARKIYEE